MVQLPIEEGKMPRIDRSGMLKQAEKWRMSGAVALFVSPPVEKPDPSGSALSVEGNNAFFFLLF